MGRSVVLAGSARCPECSLPPRWCVCDAIPPVETPIRVHVLIHRGEQRKPSSTGRLLARAVESARWHEYQRETRFQAGAGFPAEAVADGRELLILHPRGEVLTETLLSADPLQPQVLLLDGTWRQAGEMLRACEGLGRCVRLPDAASQPSRYWLRNQPAAGQLSTAEAVMGVFRAAGDVAAERRLQLHFELLVYATLLVRGHREMAERYLGHSPLLAEAPEAIHRLHARRVA